MKYIIFTVDTESDNQWDIDRGQSTENAKFIPKFQEFCESYNIAPTYLIDYSMSHNNFLVNYLKKKVFNDLCELGMHLHSWDTPPYHEYDKNKLSRPYLIEYPEEIMYEKIMNLNNYLENIFELKIVSHRAGRWATNNIYFNLLDQFGYLVDCSITPGIDWTKQLGVKLGGSNYTNYKHIPYMIGNTNLLEIPMSVSNLMQFEWDHSLSLKNNIRRFLKTKIGYTVWLRPVLYGQVDIQKLISQIDEKNYGYLEFMIHSTELMPNGSPYINSNIELINFYEKLKNIFNMLKNQYQSVTLKQYRNIYKSQII